MKCYIPEISWHNRDPVLSIDFQICQGSVRRIATAGTDAHVVIWLVTLEDNHHTNLEVAADLNRHTKTVNVVRFSPNGEMLASGDDEAAIILWKQQEKDNTNVFEEDGNENREQWLPIKILRNHIDDVCDLCWAADSQMLVSGSVDNTAIIWDINKGKNIGILSEHKGFVQGVAWDPQGQYIATLASDRIMRIYNIQTKKIVHRIQKAALPPGFASQESNKASKLFYDDTLKSFCRRLRFSPDGEFLVAPSGIQETKDGAFSNGIYIFSRHSLNKPSLWLPTGSKYTIAVSFCPLLFELRPVQGKQCQTESDENENKNPWEKYTSLFCLPYRTVFAVATQDSILVYDTQQPIPIAHISNIHYTRLSDITWSSDARILMASSTDGYCSLITFAEGELGTPYKDLKANEENTDTLLETNLSTPQGETKVNNLEAMEITPSITLETKQSKDPVSELNSHESLDMKETKCDTNHLNVDESTKVTELNHTKETEKESKHTEDTPMVLDEFIPADHNNTETDGGHVVEQSEIPKSNGTIEILPVNTEMGTEKYTPLDTKKIESQEPIPDVVPPEKKSLIVDNTCLNQETAMEVDHQEAVADVQQECAGKEPSDEKSNDSPAESDICLEDRSAEELKLELELSCDSPVDSIKVNKADGTEIIPPKPSSVDKKPPRRIQFITLSGPKATSTDAN